jgi:hypothetical protein
VYGEEISDSPTNIRYNHVIILFDLCNHLFAQPTAWGKLHELSFQTRQDVQPEIPTLDRVCIEPQFADWRAVHGCQSACMDPCGWVYLNAHRKLEAADFYPCDEREPLGWAGEGEGDMIADKHDREAKKGLRSGCTIPPSITTHHDFPSSQASPILPILPNIRPWVKLNCNLRSLRPNPGSSHRLLYKLCAAGIPSSRE